MFNISSAEHVGSNAPLVLPRTGGTQRPSGLVPFFLRLEANCCVCIGLCCVTVVCLRWYPSDMNARWFASARVSVCVGVCVCVRVSVSVGALL